MMTKKQLLLSIAGVGIPKGEVREEMFKFHNSMVGKSKYFAKRETSMYCGSCVQRVKTNIWKWYHTDETAPTYKGLYFTGKFGAHNLPIYTTKDVDQEEQ